jgi:hypothetical protein
MISERTKAALGALKAKLAKGPIRRPNGKLLRKLGGPRQREASRLGVATNKLLADQYARSILPVIEQVQRSGVVSLSGVARELQLRGMATRKGGQWSAAQVASIIRRQSS